MSLKQSPLIQIPSVRDLIRQSGADEIITIGRNSITGQTFLHTNRPVNPYNLQVLLLQVVLKNISELANQASLLIQPKPDPRHDVIPHHEFNADDNGICTACGKPEIAHITLTPGETS